MKNNFGNKLDYSLNINNKSTTSYKNVEIINNNNNNNDK